MYSFLDGAKWSTCVDYTRGDLENKELRRNIVQQMSATTRDVPGSVGERRKMRQQLENMVHQLEAESADRKENGHAGRVPSAFVTLTSAIYKWEQLHTTILKSLPADHEHRGQSLTDTGSLDVNAWRQCPPGSEEREVAMKKAFYVLSLENPGIVAWYCGLKLELGVHLLQQLITRMLQSEVVPGGDEARELLQTQLRAKMGEDSFTVEGELPDLERYGEVDDYYASVE